MAGARHVKGRRNPQEAHRESKKEIRDELNRLVEQFLAQGGVITNCNDCLPGKSRKALKPEPEILPDFD